VKTPKLELPHSMCATGQGPAVTARCIILQFTKQQT